MIAQTALEEALAHLGAAIMQSVPTDDQIIMDHVKAAHAILQVATRAQRAAAPDLVKALEEIRRLTDEQNGPSRASLLNKIAAVARAALSAAKTGGAT